MLVDEDELLVPRQVVDELEETASYDDEQGRAAEKVLRFVQQSTVGVRSVDLDPEFPLDRGENAAVALANAEDADLFLCDEFNRIGLIHASLSDARLITTPKLMEVFHRGRLLRADAVDALDSISNLRSWGEKQLRRTCAGNSGRIGVRRPRTACTSRGLCPSRSARLPSA
jgi:hypothetical protein